MQAKNKVAYKTAITRSKISAPMKWLNENGLINGKCLDFGCGKGFDADLLNIDKYDPHYYPDGTLKRYDVITCTYVLNVLEDFDQIIVLNEIKKLLRPNGVAYITVRRDIKKEGYTKKGTYQCNVVLDLPTINKKSRGYETYILNKE